LLKPFLEGLRWPVNRILRFVDEVRNMLRPTNIHMFDHVCCE
jgi:hypothetical protein